MRGFLSSNGRPRCYALVTVLLPAPTIRPGLHLPPRARERSAMTGAFMLQLYLTDVSFSIVSAALTAWAYYNWFQPGVLLEYDISSPAIDLYYRQAMALFGVFTCPAILPCFVVVESLYMRSTVALLRGYYQRPRKPFTLSQSANFLHAFSAITAIIGLAGAVWLMRHPCAQTPCATARTSATLASAPHVVFHFAARSRVIPPPPDRPTDR